eukprot:m51a1_g11781 hypothetical protein (656) ;mRNA; r:290025-292991
MACGAVHVRQFREDDASTLSSVICHALRTVNAADYPPDVIAEMCERYSPAGVLRVARSSHLLVASRSPDGPVIGSMACDLRGHVSAAFVLPDSEGAGVGRALLEELERWAALTDGGARAPLREMWAEASVTSVGFWRKMGFAEDDDPNRDTLVKVFVPEGQYKTVAVPRSADAAELRRLCIKKFALPSDTARAVYEYREEPPEVTLTRVGSGTRVSDVVMGWPASGRDATYRFVFADSGARLDPAFFKSPGSPVEKAGVAASVVSAIKDAAHVTALAGSIFVKRLHKPSSQSPPPQSSSSSSSYSLSRPETSPGPGASTRQTTLAPSYQQQQQQQQQQDPLPSAAEVLEFVNEHLKGRGLVVLELMPDLQSGSLIIEFLEHVSGLRIQNWTREPQDRAQMLANLSSAIKFAAVMGCPCSSSITAELLYDGDSSTMMRFLAPVVQQLKKRSANTDGHIMRSASGGVTAGEPEHVSSVRAPPPGSAAAAMAAIIKTPSAPTLKPIGSVRYGASPLQGAQKERLEQDQERSQFVRLRSVPGRIKPAATGASRKVSETPPYERENRKAVESAVDEIMSTLADFGDAEPPVQNHKENSPWAKQQSEPVTASDDIDNFIEREFGGIPDAVDTDSKPGTAPAPATSNACSDLDAVLQDLINS